MKRLTRRDFGRLSAAALTGAIGSTANGRSGRMWISTLDRSRRMAEQSPVTFSHARPAAESRWRIVIDAEKSFQQMLGFGSSLEPATCWNLSRLSPEKRQRVVERLVSPSHGIGMNLMRICIGTPDFTGDPWYSFNDIPAGETDPELKRFSIEKDTGYILPALRLALKINPQLLFFASPWSPPGWMKSTGSLIGGSLLPQWYAAYAAYFVRFIEAYQAAGIPIYAVTIQNEPGVDRAKEKDTRWHYPSCQWTGEQERDFIRDHLGPAFEKRRLKTRIWCYDHNFNENAEGDDPGIGYPRTILRDQRAARYVDGVAFHGYAGRPSGMSVFHREFADVPIRFTEGSVFGLRGGRQIIERLRHHASSYNSWVTMLDEKRKPNNGPFPASRTILTLNSATREVTEEFDFDLYGHFMKFIERGAVRIESSESANDIANVAFRNPDGRIVVVIINASNEERRVETVIGSEVATVTLSPSSIATLVREG